MGGSEKALTLLSWTKPSKKFGVFGKKFFMRNEKTATQYLLRHRIAVSHIVLCFCKLLCRIQASTHRSLAITKAIGRDSLQPFSVKKDTAATMNAATVE